MDMRVTTPSTYISNYLSVCSVSSVESADDSAAAAAAVVAVLLWLDIPKSNAQLPK